MKIKAWPKGDRKALCHRFSNARAGLKDREAEGQWGEVAPVIHSIGFGSFCDRRHADEEEQPVLVHLTVKAGAQDEKEWVPSKCSSGLDSLSQWARPHQARPV